MKKIFNILFKKLKKRITTLYLFILIKKIKHHTYLNKTESNKFYRLLLKYLQIFDRYEYVAISYLEEKIKTPQSINSVNPIRNLLENQKNTLPKFFSDNLSSYNIESCLGIGVNDSQRVYEETINGLIRQANNLDCDYFIRLISEQRPFHYLKYTHGFWDNLAQFAVKEYAVKNGRDLVMSNHSAMLYNLYTNNNYAENIFKLVNSKVFNSFVENNKIFFCPTLNNGSVSSKIELKILSELSKNNFLYHYSQLLFLKQFTNSKKITSSNIFKKIICTDSLRDTLINEIKKYDLVLICNHRSAQKIKNTEFKFKKIYYLPDRLQDLKHFTYPMDFAANVCETVFAEDTPNPTLILSQAGILSSFISFKILTEYEEKNISLIDVGKPLQTLFSPEITAGGNWRDANNLASSFDTMSHLMSESLFQELKEDSKIKTGKFFRHNPDMDIEEASRHQKTLF